MNGALGFEGCITNSRLTIIVYGELEEQSISYCIRLQCILSFRISRDDCSVGVCLLGGARIPSLTRWRLRCYGES